MAFIIEEIWLQINAILSFILSNSHHTLSFFNIFLIYHHIFAIVSDYLIIWNRIWNPEVVSTWESPWHCCIECKEIAPNRFLNTVKGNKFVWKDNSLKRSHRMLKCVCVKVTFESSQKWWSTDTRFLRELRPFTSTF